MLTILYSKKSLCSVALLCAGLITVVELRGVITSLDPFDPFKVYSDRDPQDYLLERRKLHKEGTTWWHEVGNHFAISVAPYFQSAKDGKPFDGGDQPVFEVVNGEPSTTNTIGFKYVPLLDIDGRTPMIPLLMSTTLPDGTVLTPAGRTYANFPLLTAAALGLFDGATPPDPIKIPNPPIPPIPNIEDIIDPGSKDILPRFGFFSLPSKYQKRGIRTDILIDLCDCIGMHLKGGFGSISHVPKPPIDETCEPLACPFTIPVSYYPNVKPENVENLLMNEFDCIVREIGMSNCDYQKTGLEELMVELYWRYPFSLNENREDWLQVLAVPYFEGGFAFSPADDVNTSELYGHMLGNNKHWAAGIAAGLCLDFVETVELGAEVGYTHFFAKDFDCYRVPNSKFQHNLYPFTTSVNIQPGQNMYYALKLTARNFLERLSGYFQFVALEHSEDCIKLLHPDPAFVPEELACRSGFKVKLANLALTYPITPNFLVGFLWQAPLSQRGTARTTTIMLSLDGRF